MLEDKSFPLPNEAFVYKVNFGCRDKWKMNTDSHHQARAEAEHTFEEQTVELKVFEEVSEQAHQEQPHQEQPHTSFHRGEGSSSHRRRLP